MNLATNSDASTSTIVHAHSAHTPGPWRVVPDSLDVVADPSMGLRGRFIATALESITVNDGQAAVYCTTDLEAPANAALIARAPELLAQVESLQATLSDAVALCEEQRKVERTLVDEASRTLASLADTMSLCEAQRKELAAHAQLIARDTATIANLTTERDALREATTAMLTWAQARCLENDADSWGRSAMQRAKDALLGPQRTERAALAGGGQ